MKQGKTARKATVKRGRRSRDETARGRWRLTIREVKVKKGSYSWTTFMLQGFKDSSGKWQRRKFKTLAGAEAFVAVKALENVTHELPQRAIVTALSMEQAREAEVAFSRLAEIGTIDGRPVSLIDAAAHYAAHLRGLFSVEKVPFREARISCLKDKEARGMRHRSVIQLESSLRAFERWLRMLPRYTAQSIAEAGRQTSMRSRRPTSSPISTVCEARLDLRPRRKRKTIPVRTSGVSSTGALALRMTSRCREFPAGGTL